MKQKKPKSKSISKSTADENNNNNNNTGRGMLEQEKQQHLPQLSSNILMDMISIVFPQRNNFIKNDEKRIIIELFKKPQKNPELFRKIMNGIRDNWHQESSQTPFCSENVSVVSKLFVLNECARFMMRIIEQTNFQENLSEKYLGYALGNLFGLAQFCYKSKDIPTLQSIVNESGEDIGFTVESCQSMLYKVITCVQKCLPNYPLKYYMKQYVQKPHFFHLLFFPQLLAKRQASEMKQLMIALVQRWICELRQFNMLSYVTKYIKNELHKTQTIPQLMSFFQHLSAPSLIALNQLIYKNSFTNFNREEIYHNIPETLSKYNYHSQTKACGYVGKSLLIDRLFYIGPQLLSNQVIIRELINDTYYYSVKHFYSLLGQAFKENYNTNTMMKLIKKWNQSLQKINIGQFCATFHLLSVIMMQDSSREHIKQQKQIVRIILQREEHIKNIYSLAITSRRQNLKHMNMLQAQVNNYLQQQQKTKKMYEFMIRGIVKYLQSLSLSYKHQIQLLLPKDRSFEQCMQSVTMYGKIANIIPHSCVRILSMRSSHNVFHQQFTKQLNNPKTTISKCLLIRQYIFAIIQAQTQEQIKYLHKIMHPKQAYIECVKVLQQEVNHMNEQELLKCKLIILQAVIEIVKKINIDNLKQIQKVFMKHTIRNDNESIKSGNTSKRTGKSKGKSRQMQKSKNKSKQNKEKQKQKEKEKEKEKESKSMNKNNKDSKSMKNFTISMKNMQNTNTNTNTNDEYEKYGSPRIRNIIFDMLQKNSKLVGKYERKLLIMIRSIIIRYLAWEVGKHKEDYQTSNHITQAQRQLLFGKQEIFIILSHVAIDEDIQIRIQILGMLISKYNDDYMNLQTHTHYYIALLMLMSSLDNRNRLKIVSQRIMKIFEEGMKGRHIGIIFMSLCYLIVNSTYQLPYKLIFSHFIDVWLRNRESQYCIYSLVEEMQRKSIKFNFMQAFQVNIKAYKVCGNRNSNSSNHNNNGNANRKPNNFTLNYKQIRDNDTQQILQIFKKTMQQKLKKCRYLKSKKCMIVEWQQLQGIGLMRM